MNEPTQQHIPKQTDKIRTTKVVYPQVYSYTLPDEEENEGSQKIGYTERKDVDKRIYEQTHTAAKRHKSEKLWSAPAFFKNEQKDFRDTDFHEFLIKSEIQHRPDLGREWYYFNGTPQKSKELFDTFREKGYGALQTGDGKLPYNLRAEQEDAVVQAGDYFNNNENGEFLWNAKPRFGKTLASYDLAKKLNAKKVLIVTNRPAIANSWFDDFEDFIDGYHFISETSSLSERKTISRDQYNDLTDKKPFITFLSLQDLKGSRYFGGSHDKLKWIADLEWDLLVIDEAHEGIDTSRTDAAFDIVNRSHTLHLSGTPFKALANNKFPSKAIFNWTYLDEQERKREELREGESGPHTDLPDLRLYTYRISQMTANEVNDGIEIDEESRDYAFDLNEFFATKNQKFIHEEDVKNFLKNLTNNTKYPFSTPELRDQLRHTFWYVGNRVESVKALEQLLKQDDIFKDYKIVVAAGDGKSFDEEEADFKKNEKSFDKVKEAIKNHPKTITLSCGQLTTGVTVKEWSAVLMLTDMKSTPQYMQAAFRAQNPYRFLENGELKAKKSAYLFDFAPTRVLEMYDEFANGLNPKATNGTITDAERKENIKELLNYFPVISEDVNGRMIELDAEKVLAFPNALAATEIVKARFMTNLLFNDNIKGVFHFPKEVEDILNKMPVEKNKRAEKTKTTLDLDDARKVEQAKQTKINENSDVILGEKIYRANIDRVVDNAIGYETPEETLENLPDQVSAIAEPLIAKYKQTYNATNSEIEVLQKETEEKIKLVVAEYESSEIKDPDTLKENLVKVIEHDFVGEKVEQQEEKKVQEVQKTKEEEVRDHLRAFTRTIPMFIMANSSKETITIDNFDEEINDNDFEDLTNITRAEFHMLRDGFEYEQDGERKHFGGVFEKYRFNASIAEFVAEKKQRADYFKTDEDIFELIPNQKNNQIFTPRKVVKMMVDGLEEEQPDLFRRTDSTFIDLYMKSGMYITEIVKKLFANTRHNYSSDTECLKHILENQVYGLAPTSVLHGITTSYIFGFDAEHNISGKNFAQHDLLPQAKEGTAAEKLGEMYNGGNMMKFDAVVGNPPYQVALSENKMSRSIYPDFTRTAKKVSDVVSLVMPARWMSGENGPYRETQGFVNEMLEGSHLKSFALHPDSSELFSGVDIKGGICYFVWDKNYSKDLVSYTLSENGMDTTADVPFRISDNIIVRFPQLTSIIQKISRNTSSDSMKTLVSSRNPFGFVSDLFVKNNEGVRRISEAMEEKDDHRIIGLLKGKRVYRYIPNDELKKNRKGAESWKVFVPRANGSGAFGETFSTPMVGPPMLVCTDTFLQVGEFDEENEANSVLQYVKTKFFRAIVGVKKTAVFNYKDAFTFVPILDFTVDSDIDWTKSITEIDQQLYKKYGLNQEEIDFIESRVKSME
jgi:type II restriction enzyme